MPAQQLLRIIGSMKWELPTIRMSIREAIGQVDAVVILEHNFSHTGKPHDFQLTDGLSDLLGTSNGTTVSYVQVDLSDQVVRDAASPGDMHRNEELMRGSFEAFTEVRENDIVYCVDADEVIYSASFRFLGQLVRRDPFRRVWAIPMHQLYYRPDYLWTDCNFASAVVGRAQKLRLQKNPWRDSRWRARGIHGCHFSWQLTVDQMLTKLGMYAHAADFAHLSTREVLDDAVRLRHYPFDPLRPFTIQQLDDGAMDRLFPASWATEGHGLRHLLGDVR